MLPNRRIHLRDRIAHRLANAALRIATPWYRDMIGGAISYGMRSAARDADEYRTAPPPLYEHRIGPDVGPGDFVR